MTKKGRAMPAARRTRGAAMAGVVLCWLSLGSQDGALGAAGPAAESAEPASAGAPDGPAAFKAWLPRALAGDPAAAYRLGRAYAEGESRREDFLEAARWFRKAAQAGHGPAQADLAMLYGKGQGVPQDYVWSYAWFAAAADNLDGGLAREEALELRDMMAAFLSPDQRARAERLATELKAIRAR